MPLKNYIFQIKLKNIQMKYNDDSEYHDDNKNNKSEDM